MNRSGASLGTAAAGAARSAQREAPAAGARAALQSIPVVVLPAGLPSPTTPAALALTGPSTAALALLHEIATRVDALLMHGEVSRIDLRSLPLAPADLERLRALLGRGAVQARLDALGDSEVYETGCPGVWWLTHRDAGGEVMAELIEVAAMPAILASPREDIVDGQRRLQRLLRDDESQPKSDGTDDADDAPYFDDEILRDAFRRAPTED